MSNPAESPQTLVIDRVFPHPPQKVWRALTENPLLGEWLMKNDFEPVVGRKFQFRAQPVAGWDGVVDCEVRIVDPLKRLSYTFNSMGLDFVIQWTLTPQEGGTLLSMEQSGFKPTHPKAAYQGAKYGWERFLGNLEKQLGEEV